MLKATFPQMVSVSVETWAVCPSLASLGVVFGGPTVNTACAMCGRPMVVSLSERGSYFEAVMRLSRPGPAAWPRYSAKERQLINDASICSGAKAAAASIELVPVV